MKVTKPQRRSCSCGNLKVILYGRGRAVVTGGWLRVHQLAVCDECEEAIRVAPRIDFADQDGEVYHEGQE